MRGYSHWSCSARRERDSSSPFVKNDSTDPPDRWIETKMFVPLERRRCLYLGRIFCSARPFFMVSSDTLIHRARARWSSVPLEFLNGEPLFMSQAFGQARRDSALRRERAGTRSDSRSSILRSRITDYPRPFERGRGCYPGHGNFPRNFE